MSKKYIKSKKKVGWTSFYLLCIIVCSTIIVIIII